MPLMTAVPDDHPLMVAWKRYRETEDYKNTRDWYGQPGQDPDGTLWAAFMAGWEARIPMRSATVVIGD